MAVTNENAQRSIVLAHRRRRAATALALSQGATLVAPAGWALAAWMDGGLSPHALAGTAFLAAAASSARMRLKRTAARVRGVLAAAGTLALYAGSRQANWTVADLESVRPGFAFLALGALLSVRAGSLRIKRSVRSSVLVQAALGLFIMAHFWAVGSLLEETNDLPYAGLWLSLALRVSESVVLGAFLVAAASTWSRRTSRPAPPRSAAAAVAGVEA
jgi:hypothetical protein